MDRLRISATAHGLNYLPEYHASRTGGFARRALRVEATPRDPWTGVLDDLAAGAADVALGGIWAPAMYAGRGRDLVAVGQLNARFPMVVVTRQPIDGFAWDWMRDKTVLAPGAGGTAPYEFTAGLMREAGVAPASVRFVRDLSSGMLVELFEHGLGDAVIVDLLTAMLLQRRGAGYLSCRLADVGGVMPNSVYYVQRDRLEELHDRLVGLLGGVQEAMTALNEGADPGETLIAEWPDLPTETLRDAVTELVANKTWSDIRIDPAACARWIDILRTGGLVASDLRGEDLVDTATVDAVGRLQMSAPG